MFFNGCEYFMGQQVTVMFQIVSTLMEEVPAFALRMRELRGEQQQVQLMDNPWGHGEDCAAKMQLPRFGPNGRIRTLPNSQDRLSGFDTAGQR